jgi:CRP/FNR family cyclic AMP-dependent transcriptional regulator
VNTQATEPLLAIEDVLPILSDISVFGGLTEAQLHTVFQLLERASFKRREFVFEQGDPPSHIYIVLKGKVELVLNVEGSYLAQAVFPVGHCFGETSAIGIEPHTASAIAVEPTDLIVLPTSALFKIWELDKALFGMLILNIAREACRRLAKTDETLLHYFAHHEHHHALPQTDSPKEQATLDTTQ